MARTVTIYQITEYGITDDFFPTKREAEKALAEMKADKNNHMAKYLRITEHKVELTKRGIIRALKWIPVR